MLIHLIGHDGLISDHTKDYKQRQFKFTRCESCARINASERCEMIYTGRGDDDTVVNIDDQNLYMEMTIR